MTDTVAVEIPADVRDNSATTTDYAFRRDIAQGGWPYHTIATRNAEILRVDQFPRLQLVRYQWYDVNPDGQRCRFDMIVDRHGHVVNLYHTEFWTRMACYQGDWCCSYAAHYVTTEGGTLPVTDPVPVCAERIEGLRRSFEGSPVTLHLSEPLRIGQHN